MKQKFILVSTVIVLSLIFNLLLVSLFIGVPWERHNFAMVTMIATPDYVAGALLLLDTWKKFTPKSLGIETHALIVAENIPHYARKALEEMGWVLHSVAPLSKLRRSEGIQQRIPVTFTKLKLWSAEAGLTGFRQLLYIDSDAMLVGPVHELAIEEQYLPLAAVMSAPTRWNSGVFSFNASNEVNLFPLMASSLLKTYTDLMRMYEKDNYFMKTGGEQDLVKIVS